MPSEEQKVLIAGAGPAGAALAQILRKNNIAYEIFERETDMNARRGNGFTLDDSLKYLDEMMPDDLGDYATASANYSIGDLDSFAYVDAIEGKIVARHDSPARDQPGFTMAARRKHFRNWSTQHLPIQIGKKLSRYEEDDDGVTAYFSDGSSSRGTLLVGADGAGSLVRKQLLGDSPLELNEYVPIGGDVKLPRNALSALREIATGAVILKSPQAHMALVQLEVNREKTEALFWWCIAFKSEDPAADTAWVHAASPQSLYKRALASISHYPETIQDAVRRGGPEGMWNPQLKFTEWAPPRSGLPRGRVTLIGDAAHNTTPFGGMGANIGLIDACELGKLLVEREWGSYGELETLLRVYERTMIPRGRATVLGSRGVALDEESKAFTIGRRLKYIEPVPLEMPLRPSEKTPEPAALH